jgi:hypothetical protein
VAGVSPFQFPGRRTTRGARGTDTLGQIRSGIHRSVPLTDDHQTDDHERGQQQHGDDAHHSIHHRAVPVVPS